MTTLLDEPVTRPSTSPVQQLRTTMAATRVSLQWLGVRKTLTPAQKCQAAEMFSADGQFLSAGKKLLDTKHPAFRAVTAVRHRIVSTWHSMTLPFPEPGLRLIRQDDVETFNRRMTGLRQELDEAVWRLDEHYAQLKSAARGRLGSLYNPADYPESLGAMFRVEWEFPNVDAPSYLQQLNPALYAQECRRVAARFDEAVQLAEEAFLAELTGLVTHLTERLTGQTDGKRSYVRQSCLTQSLTDTLVRQECLTYKSDIRSNEQLDFLVDQAQQIIQGVEPQALRDDRVLRDTVGSE